MNSLNSVTSPSLEAQCPKPATITKQGPQEQHNAEGWSQVTRRYHSQRAHCISHNREFWFLWKVLEQWHCWLMISLWHTTNPDVGGLGFFLQAFCTNTSHCSYIYIQWVTSKIFKTMWCIYILCQLHVICNINKYTPFRIIQIITETKILNRMNRTGARTDLFQAMLSMLPHTFLEKKPKKPKKTISPARFAFNTHQ